MKILVHQFQSYLGDRLYEWKKSNWNGDNTKYCLNVPIKLLGKIIIIINYNMNTSDGKGLIYEINIYFLIAILQPMNLKMVGIQNWTINK